MFTANENIINPVITHIETGTLAILPSIGTNWSVCLNDGDMIALSSRTQTLKPFTVLASYNDKYRCIDFDVICDDDNDREEITHAIYFQED